MKGASHVVESCNRCDWQRTVTIEVEFTSTHASQNCPRCSSFNLRISFRTT